MAESGTDGVQQVKVGIGPVIKRQEGSFPCLVVFPQSREKTWQAGSKDGLRAMAIFEEVKKLYRWDPARVYLTGLSMGGFGTWSMAARYPNQWAAIVPICGGG